MKKKQNKPSGFAKPVSISKELCEFLNKQEDSKITSFFAKISLNNHKTIFTLTIVVIIFSLIGISRLEVENSFINYFSKKTEIYKGMKLIDEKLGGTTPLEVILKFPKKENKKSDDDDFEDWEDEENDRVVMKIDPKIAPVLAVVCPLVKKDGLPEMGRKIMDILKKEFKVIYDQQGSIGKRYYRQDEAGTPFGITIDHQSIDDQSVTLRHRDTQHQDRVAVDQLVNAIKHKLENFYE